MEVERRRNRFREELNKRMYMDLKDIVREHTLPFLPAKSLVRCRAVCWDWNRWILNPFLAHSQSYFCKDVSGMFFQSKGAPPSFISLDPKACGIPDPSLVSLGAPFSIRASSSGLLCCQADTGEKAYYVCNPVNKQSKILPKPNCYHGVTPALVLIFEPSLLSFAANYKVICAFPSSDFDDGHEFEIYSSETGSWKLSGEICFGTRVLVPESGVHVKGNVYWMSNNYIVAFDLAKDRSRLIDSFGFDVGCLTEMHGELCHINMSNRTILVRTLSNVYSNTMEMGSGSFGMWSLKHRISLYDVWQEKKLSIEKPVLLFAGGSLVIAQVGEDTLISYDMKTKQTSVFPRLPRDDPEKHVVVRCIPYVNSLVSLT